MVIFIELLIIISLGLVISNLVKKRFNEDSEVYKFFKKFL